MTPIVEMITLLLVASALLYAVMMLLLSIGFERATRAQMIGDYVPTVSVIVAARNEEKHIEACVDSLLRIEYPKEKLEIIIVNDGSTDRTVEKLHRLKQSSSIRSIDARPGKGNLLGKTNAITQGIEASSGEILMFTDADCTVDPGWVRRTVQYFTPDVGVVGGFTLLRADRIFEGVQSLDWIFLFCLASSTAGWKMPLTAIGNNLSVRRSAYDLTGGYREIPFSVTEDYALVRAIREKTPLEVCFPSDLRALVTSNACQNWKQLFRQKQRWGVGGLDMILHGVLIMLVGWLFRLFLLTGILISPWPVLSIVLAVTFIIDARFIGKALWKFKAIRYLKYLPAFECYFTLYVLAIPFIAIFSRNVVWKERSL